MQQLRRAASQRSASAWSSVPDAAAIARKLSSGRPASLNRYDLAKKEGAAAGGTAARVRGTEVEPFRRGLRAGYQGFLQAGQWPGVPKARKSRRNTAIVLAKPGVAYGLLVPTVWYSRTPGPGGSLRHHRW